MHAGIRTILPNWIYFDCFWVCWSCNIL